MADIFLSYRNLPDRRAIVARLAYILDAHKISVWWDYGLDAGDSYREQITREMASARIVIPLWCEESVASPWVLMEAELGKDKLFPARLQPVAPPAAFEAIHAAHLENWKGSINDPALMDYIRRICVRLGKPDDLPGYIREQLAALPAISPLGPVRKSLPAAAAPAAPQALWSPIEQSLDPRDYEDFLTHHPQASQAAEARRRLRQLADWEQVDQQNGAAIKAFRDRAKERSKLYPALDALVLRRYRQVGAAERSSADGASKAKTPSRLPAALLAGLLIAGGASAGVWFADPLGWRRGADEAAVAAAPDIAIGDDAPGEAEVLEIAAVEVPAEDEAALVAASFAEREQALQDALDKTQAEQAERDRIAREKAAQEERDRKNREDNAAREREYQQVLANNRADDDAWQIARSSGTLAGLEAYLSRYPSGRNANAARTEMTRLKAFNADILHPDVKRAVLEARTAAATARTNAAEANRIFGETDALITEFRKSGTGLTRQDFSEATYEVQVVNGKRSGLGAQWTTGGTTKGAVYRGQWSMDTTHGYGVMDFSAAAGPGAGDRYEGSFVQGSYTGAGVYKWKSGNVYAGQYNANVQLGYGVMNYAGGSRYEGQWQANNWSGYGVIWNADGTVRSAGRWGNGALEQSLSK